MPYVNFKDFIKDESLKDEELSPHSHSIYRGTLAHTSSQIWYSKACYNQFDAFSELIGQNFFKLILSDPQPNSLLAIDFIQRRLYCLSEEVTGFTCLPNGKSTNISNQIYNNLPQILLISHFLEEIDLKNGNIGLNHNNYVVKIDGDLCFASLKTKIHYKHFSINTQTIANLPLANHFYTYNWLDIVKAEKKYLSSEIIDIKSSDDTIFQTELSQAILRICLLPKSFLLEFLKNHLQPIGNFFEPILLRHFFHLFSSFFLCRQQMLNKAACNYEPFKYYLFSLHAERDLSFLSQQLSNPYLFIPNGIPAFIHNYAASIKNMEENLFQFRLHFFPLIELAQINIRLLLKSLKHAEQWPVLLELITQHLKHSSSFESFGLKTQTIIAIMDSLHHLNRIQELKINPLDELTNKFCQQQLDEIKNNNLDSEKIILQKNFLFKHFFQTRLAYQNIFHPIRTGLNAWNWWKLQSNTDKALEFEQQIIMLPFEERAKTLCSPNFATKTEQKLFQQMFFKPNLKDLIDQAPTPSTGLWV